MYHLNKIDDLKNGVHHINSFTSIDKRIQLCIHLFTSVYSFRICTILIGQDKCPQKIGWAMVAFQMHHTILSHQRDVVTIGSLYMLWLQVFILLLLFFFFNNCDYHLIISIPAWCVSSYLLVTSKLCIRCSRCSSNS